MFHVKGPQPLLHKWANVENDGFCCFRSARVCAEDCVVGDLSVKKGVHVMFSAQTLHNDPELWSEPDKFDPERYTHMYIICDRYLY